MSSQRFMDSQLTSEAGSQDDLNPDVVVISSDSTRMSDSSTSNEARAGSHDDGTETPMLW